MQETSLTYIHDQLIGGGVLLTRHEFCRACGIAEEHLPTWIIEGVIEPIGRTPEDWQFDAVSLRRARVASRLTQDLALNLAGAALALDLLDQISELKARLRRMGQD